MPIQALLPPDEKTYRDDQVGEYISYTTWERGKDPLYLFHNSLVRAKQAMCKIILKTADGVYHEQTPRMIVASRVYKVLTTNSVEFKTELSCVRTRVRDAAQMQSNLDNAFPTDQEEYMREALHDIARASRSGTRRQLTNYAQEKLDAREF